MHVLPYLAGLTGDAPLAVIPVLMGPLQVLLALLPAIAAAVFRLVMAFLRPSAFTRGKSCGDTPPAISAARFLRQSSKMAAWSVAKGCIRPPTRESLASTWRAAGCGSCARRVTSSLLPASRVAGCTLARPMT